MKYCFFGLPFFFLQTIVFAQATPDKLIGTYSLRNSVTVREQACFKPWIDALKKPGSNRYEIEMLFRNALLCTDPCVSTKDAIFFATQCYDWNTFLELHSQKELSFHEALQMVFDTKFVSCSQETISKAKKTGQIDGIFFDPIKNLCSKPDGNDYVTLLKKTVRMGMGGLYTFGDNHSFTHQHDGGVTVEAGVDLLYRNPAIVFDMQLKVAIDKTVPHQKNGAPLGDSTYTRNELDLRADLEAALYKTFGSQYTAKHCAIMVGPKVLGKINTEAKKSTQYIPLEGGVQASLRALCATPDLVWSLTLNGDLFRATAFELPDFKTVNDTSVSYEAYKPQRLLLLTYPGREFDLQAKIDFKNVDVYFGIGAFWYQYTGNDFKAVTLNGGGYYRFTDFNPAAVSKSGPYIGLDTQFDAYDFSKKGVEVPKKEGFDFTGQLVGGILF